MVTENKTQIKQYQGLNGPDKAQTLTTTVRLRSSGNKTWLATGALNHAGSDESRFTHAEGMRNQINETPYAEEVRRASVYAK